MKRTKWVDRKFNLGIPEGWLPNVIARLSGITIRLKDLTSKLSEESLSLQLNEHWSIKEHIGHLIDLEDLHIGRVTDFVNRKQTLRAADMSNKQTYSANHNEKSISQLINEFDFDASAMNVKDGNHSMTFDCQFVKKGENPMVRLEIRTSGAKEKLSL